MSVLNFPRIYLKGHMFWNPPTGNNNDMMPLYDAVNMKMNWDFLKQYDITPENAPETLIPWMIQYQALGGAPECVIQAPPNAGAKGIVPAEWDLFGDNACGTVSYNGTVSTIIGGELPGGGYVDSDPLIDQPYNLYGNPFGSDTPTPARFVDVSPWQNTFTALYFDRLVLGNDKCGLTAKRQYRMLDRFLNFNWGAFGGLLTVTATWQTCFPKANLEWAIGDSALLQNLYDQMEAQNAQGLMFRFCSYLTTYDLNGVLNDQPKVSAKTDPDTLHQMYQAGLANPIDIFFNPAYGCTSGVLGLWHEDEYPTAPAGRRMVANAAVAVPPPYDKATDEIQLGVVSAQVHDNVLSLDLMNSFPFVPDPASGDVPEPLKLDLGAFDVGFDQNGTFVPVNPPVSFDYTKYQQSAFYAQSGLLDLPLTPAQVTQLSGDTPLALRKQGDQPPTSVQQPWTAEVIESGSFVDVGQTKTLTIMVQKNGKPAANLDLLVAEYNNPYLLGTSSYYLGTRDNPNFVLFHDHPGNRKLNKENFPQFTDSPDVVALATEGAGRRLTAFVMPEATDDVGTPIYYQDYRTTCAGVNLGACLRFEDREPSVIRRLKPDGQLVEYDYKRITTGPDGVATVTVTGINPGFPTLRFYPDEDGTADIVFSFDYLGAYMDFLAPIRVLPNEDDLKQRFVEQWNKVYLADDPGQEIWDTFIYPEIFEIYYYLYPIMSKYMPLNNLKRIEGAIGQLIRLISKPYQEESTLAMPITRDMPQGRRSVLELWAQKLVQRNYPPVQLSMADYDTLKVQ